MGKKASFMRRSCDIFNNQKRRARQSGKTLPYTLEELRAYVLPHLGAPCCFCGQTLTAANFSLDHGVPLSRHGEWTLSHLVVCCLRCNQVKGIMTGYEFRLLLDLIATWESAVKLDLLARLRAGGRFRR
jgi:5-methylcytosine-specific restriction endonuclease McrA